MASKAGNGINWWLIIGGALLVLCGIAIFVAPGFFLEFLTVWAGIGFLVSGAMGIASYFKVRKIASNAAVHLYMAILDLAIGLLLILHPFAFSTTLPWLLGVGFIAFGVIEIAGLMPFARLMPEARTVVIISGVLSILVGVMFIVWPASLSIWVAAFALVRGITLAAMGFTSR